MKSGLSKMEPATLKDLAICNLLDNKWRTKSIKKVLHSIGMCNTNGILALRKASGNEYFNDEKLMKEAEALAEDFMSCDLLPYHLKLRLASAIISLVFELRDKTIMVICNGLKYRNKANVQYCIHRICLTPPGAPDIAKTVLKVIADSSFCVEFRQEFLYEQVIEKESLMRIIEDQKEREKHIKLSKVRNKFIPLDSDILNGYTSSILDYFGKIASYDRTQGLLKFLVCRRSSRSVAYCYKHSAANEDALVKAIEFCFDTSYPSPDMVMFFSKNISYKNWIPFLIYNFRKIFEHLILCWRYRDVAVEWWYRIAAALNADDFVHLFKPFFQKYVDEPSSYHIYEWHDIKETLKHIWSVTPTYITGSQEALDTGCNLIKFINIDVPMLKHILRTYESKQQRDLVADIVLYATTIPNQAIGNYCLSLLDGTDEKQVLTEDALITYILKHPVKDQDLCAITEYVFKCKHNIANFKHRLLEDIEFLRLFLEKHWDTDPYDFLLWCNDRNITSTNKCVRVLLSNKTINIEGIFEQILRNTGMMSAALKGLESLKIPKETINEMKLNAMGKPDIKKLVLTKLLTDVYKYQSESSYNSSHFTDVLRDLFCVPKEDQQGFIKNLLTSQLFVEVLYMFISHGDLYSSRHGGIAPLPCVRTFQFVKEVLKRNGAIIHARSMFLDSGPPPVPAASPRARPNLPPNHAQVVIDFRYRTFLAILIHDYSTSHLCAIASTLDDITALADWLFEGQDAEDMHLLPLYL